jgi:hypothetical protein
MTTPSHLMLAYYAYGQAIGTTLGLLLGLSLGALISIRRFTSS